jgi:hypothetical protein
VGQHRRLFSGETDLLTFALPNFFFHVTIAYYILHHAGVTIGKRDYLGSFGAKSCSIQPGRRCTSLAAFQLDR